MIALLFLPLSAWAASVTDTAYFNLHQATGFFELYIGQQCPSGKQKAVLLLESLRGANLNKEVAAKAKQLSTWIGQTKAPPMAEIESYRLSLHRLQERLELPHKKDWHEAVVAQCKLPQQAAGAAVE
jgi:hypothetical protein